MNASQPDSYYESEDGTTRLSLVNMDEERMKQDNEYVSISQVICN